MTSSSGSLSVFQIGAAGGVGRRLARLLTGRGDRVTGMYRRPEQAGTVEESGATPLPGDLVAMTVDELAAAFDGHDAVVFSAGAHGTGAEQTTAIDGDGLRKAADAAARAGVRRFVLVSSFPEAGRGGEPKAGFEHYARVKKAADVYLAATDLDWVIVRPGTLRDELTAGAVAGSVTAGAAVAYGDVARDNVAAFLAAVVHEPRLSREIVELTDGPVPVEEAVARLLR